VRKEKIGGDVGQRMRSRRDFIKSAGRAVIFANFTVSSSLQMHLN